MPILLRRTASAFTSYHDAKLLTHKFLESRSPSQPGIRLYNNAVTKWEHFILESQICIDLLNHVNGNNKLFQKLDGSQEQRLYTIANHIKHVPKVLRSQNIEDNEVMPLWLSNEGLESYGQYYLSYIEASEHLRGMAMLADDVQDPRSAVDKWRSESAQLDLG
jgi:hypothetical protein